MFGEAKAQISAVFPGHSHAELSRRTWETLKGAPLDGESQRPVLFHCPVPLARVHLLPLDSNTKKP